MRRRKISKKPNQETENVSWSLKIANTQTRKNSKIETRSNYRKFLPKETFWPNISSIPNHCSAFIWALFFALSMFFTEQRENFQISCHLIGWKKSLFVRLFWKLSQLQNNSLWDQISIDEEPSLRSTFSLKPVNSKTRRVLSQFS